ncbi:MAG: hypothetical protein KUG68_03175 [Flavobacteriaceae bacterium]|nr:hypothetical protein [Flavobacteriaceae bacterium]
MKTTYKFPIFLLLIFLFASCGSDDNSGGTSEPMFVGEVDWIKTFGGSAEDDAISVVQANDGNYVILGFTNSIDGDLSNRSASDYDFWVLKISTTGEKIWSKNYGGTNDEKATSLIKTNDGGFAISGYSKSDDGDVSGNGGFWDYWLLKIDSEGNKQWDKTFGFAGDDKSYKVIQTNDGGYFMTGYLDLANSGGQGDDIIENDESGTRNSLHGLGEYWAIKTDGNGNKLWRRYFGGTNNDRSYDVIQTDDNGFLMVGAAESLDFDISDPRGSYDFWALKISNSGDRVWEKSFGGSEIDNGFSIVQADDGNYLFAGNTRSNNVDVSNLIGNADTWVVKFSAANGDLIWEKTYGGTQFDTALNINKLANGNYVLSGHTRSSDGDVTNHQGLNDVWILVIDDFGTIQYEKIIGGTNLDFANHGIETTNKELIIVGSTESTDGDLTQNLGSKDLLIVKIK